MAILQIMLTIISLIGSGLAWWWANASHAAKNASEEALTRARETLSAVQTQAAALEELAEQGRQPMLSAAYQTGDTWLLTNNTDAEVTIDEVLNAESEGLHNDLSGARINPHGSVSFMLLPIQLPDQEYALELKCAGDSGPIRVPYPPKPKRR